MWPVFSLAGTTAEAALLWEAGVGYTQFTEYVSDADVCEKFIDFYSPVQYESELAHMLFVSTDFMNLENIFTGQFKTS